MDNMKNEQGKNYSYTYEDGKRVRFLGRAAERRVESEILNLGINVFVPSIDDGVDLVTEFGDRIQVKASRNQYSNTRGYKYPCYIFVTRKKKYVSATGKTIRAKIKPGSIDFLICWGVEDDVFFIIPEYDITTSIVKIPINKLGRESKYAKYINAWHLLKDRKGVD